MSRWSLTAYPLISALSLGLWAFQPTAVPESHWGRAATQWLGDAPAAGHTGAAMQRFQALQTQPFAAGPSSAGPVASRFSGRLNAPVIPQERR